MACVLQQVPITQRDQPLHHRFAAARLQEADALGLRRQPNAFAIGRDGGARRAAALNPVLGRDRIARYFAGLARKARLPRAVVVHPVRVNDLPSFVSLEEDGTLQAAAIEAAAEGLIGAIYIVRNPEKLRHLASVLRAADGLN